MFKLRLPFFRNKTVESTVHGESFRSPEADPVDIETGFFVNRKGLAWAIFFMTIFGIAFSASIFIYIVGSNPVDEASQNVAVDFVEETPEPTPTPAPARGEFAVQVLNATKTPGLASQVKDYLERLGYQDVAIGNTTGDFPETILQAKESKKDFLDTVNNDLSGKYKVNSSQEFLDEAAEYDFVITLGQK